MSGTELKKKAKGWGMASGQLFQGSSSKFFLQTCLVLAPLILLAGLGFLLLAKDKTLSDREAMDIAAVLSTRAGSEASRRLDQEIETLIHSVLPPEPSSTRPDLLPAKPSELFDSSYVWLRNQAGDLINPKQMEAVFLEPWLEAEKSGPAKAFYTLAVTTQYQAEDLPKAAALFDQAASVAASDAFRTAAEYKSGCVYRLLGDDDKASLKFSAALAIPNFELEPYAQLAAWNLVSIERDPQARDRHLEALLARVAAKPAPLGAMILADLRSQANLVWSSEHLEQWKQANWALMRREQTINIAEEARFQFSASQMKAGGSPAKPFVFDGADFLLLGGKIEGGNTIGLALNQKRIQQIAAEIAMQPDSGRIPKFFGLSIALEGSSIPAPPDFQELARTLHPLKPYAGAGELTPGFQLVSRAGFVDRNGYFRRQQQRSAWFVALICAAGFSSAAGLFLMNRGYEKLRQVTEMQGNFVASVSHELRSPLASIRLLAESLGKGKIIEKERQQQYFHLIFQESRRLGGLVENLLTFVRTTRGASLALRQQPVDLWKIAAECVEVIQPAAAVKQVTLTLSERLESHPPDLLKATRILPPKAVKRSMNFPSSAGGRIMAMGDPRSLAQVFLNLLDNAVKFSPEKSEVKIHLCPKVKLAGIEWASFTVADSGPGMDPAQHQTIFQMFYRIGSELTRETPGVGIGLGLVKQIVAAHGGGVFLASNPGEGSVFTILIPKGNHEADE
jgi:signal transduction histidine kinase